MEKTGIVRDIRYMDHHPGFGHPESPRRLEVLYDMLEDPDMAGRFQDIPAREADTEELCLIHSLRYIKRVASTAERAHDWLDPDTTTSSGSYEAALLAAGGLCEAVSRVASGELDNAFALVRPPGHHAETDEGRGFCLFNNVAIGARYAQTALHLKRILIVDWDLHHGNGTQHSFESDPSILYFSTHQYPYYPGSGASHEVGRRQGEGFTVNVPLGTGYGDGEYAAIFEKILKPIVPDFKPELILVSAGFDIYRGDPLGGMKVSPKGFAGLTRLIMEIAASCCGGKIVFTLEGGYDLKGLRDSVKAVLKELAGLAFTNYADMMAGANPVAVDMALKSVLQVQSRYWKNLRP
ncbi:Acetoin utilization deacetylase AcuC [Syntrophus gentianae]|uniref:histone deacetylase n=1 Tax=Syntrophus gentianae TaxID=43775 RepID=A0A1H7U969_9BACT|nr:histone deacetylase [Syntrophus gentianae]SEL92827.1 Acetoin utilization deacetylase AcuC [Syntrophus gentianae]